MGESEKIWEKIFFEVICPKIKQIRGFQGHPFKFEVIRGFRGFRGPVATLSYNVEKCLLSALEASVGFLETTLNEVTFIQEKLSDLVGNPVDYQQYFSVKYLEKGISMVDEAVVKRNVAVAVAVAVGIDAIRVCEELFCEMEFGLMDDDGFFCPEFDEQTDRQICREVPL